MTTLSMTSPTTPSMIHLRLEDKQMVHMPITDMLPVNGLLLLKETRTISQTRILMRKLLDSSEPIRTPFHTNLEEEIPLIQLTDGLTLHQALMALPKEPPRILETPTSMRKLSDSSEPIRT